MSTVYLQNYGIPNSAENFDFFRFFGAMSCVNFGPDNRLYEKYFLCSPLKAYDSTRGSPTNRFLKPTSITMGIVWLMMSSTTQSNEYRAVKRNLLRLFIRVKSFFLYGLLSQIVAAEVWVGLMAFQHCMNMPLAHLLYFLYVGSTGGCFQVLLLLQKIWPNFLFLYQCYPY